jgi:FkbM family methyltransferase
VTLELVNGTWCPAGDPYFDPLVRAGGFNDAWTFDQAMVHLRERRVVLDIGAHIGLWTRELAQEFRAVVAFEPDPENFTALRRNTEHLANVRALPLAVAPHTGRYRLSHDGMINSGEGYLVPATAGDDWVIGVRLDDCQFEQVDLIKADVEGCEWEVFANGERTIHHCKPVIILEENHRIGPRYGGKPEDARQMLQDWGMIEVARKEFIPGAFDVVMRWR